uniref:Uncharacterized protein n=1 Tax=Glycine max TaxID=3847 RepID=C6SW26_SOYBN|nr:unknown [Glycine max]
MPWPLLLRLLISTMFMIASLLLPISRRNLIVCMGMGGNVWWDPILGAISPIHQGLSSILLWRPLIFLSLREHLLDLSYVQSEVEYRVWLSEKHPYAVQDKFFN